MALRVLHVAQPTEAGVAVCAHDLAADQKRRGFDVSVVAPRHGDLAGWLSASGVDHIQWDATRSPGPSSLAESRSLRRIVQRISPDVLHLHSSKAGLAGRLGGRGAPAVVFQPHAWSFEAVGGILGRAALAWERRAASRTDAIVCVSEAERRTAVGAGIDGRFEVIPNGVDLDRWTVANDEDRAAARRDLGLGPEPLVVCIGRVSEQKGQDVLLGAWPQVKSAHHDARLMLVGDGPARAELEAKKPAGVTFMGRRDDVPLWLAACDVVAMPSRWEGMSLAMLEAMASGRSVVATAVAGAEEVIGDAGAIVPVEDAGALARALSERLADAELRAIEGVAARRVVEERHDIERTRSAVVALYDELTNHSNA